MLNLREYEKAIIHIDCDAFFASVEQAINPKLKGKPVITGKERGIVSAASYEAKALGIKRGVKLWDVKKICPNAIILPSDYETYSLFSKRLFEIIRRFTPLVEEYSIDEAFVDITGFSRPYHASYEQIALKIKSEIESSLGITVSVGLSCSKVLAKIGSKWKKPAGFTPIPGYQIEQFLKNLEIGNIWGIGEKTAAYCQALGINTALQFAQKPIEFIKQHFTKPHQEIWFELNGKSIYEIKPNPHTDYASISKFRTFTPPSTDKKFILAQLIKNLENACIKSRRHNLQAQKIIIALKDQEFKISALEAKLNRPSSYPNDMVEIANKLFDTLYRPHKEYRATGIVLVNLQQQGNTQLDLFEEPLQIEKMEKIYQAVDQIAEKFGKHAIHLGTSTQAHQEKQHSANRDNTTLRKQNRLQGENERLHLGMPLIMNIKI